MNKTTLIFAGLLGLATFSAHSDDTTAPVRFAIVGLVHDHARGFIPNVRDRRDVELVGIVEPNQQLVQRYAKTSISAAISFIPP